MVVLVAGRLFDNTFVVVVVGGGGGGSVKDTLK